MNRRRFLLGLGLAGAGLTGGYHAFLDQGLHNPCYQGLPESLTRHPLYASLWADLDSALLWDCHVHMVGTGDSGQGIWVNPASFSWWSPLRHSQMLFYLNAACVQDASTVDGAFTERLIALYNAFPAGAKGMLLAFDYHYNEKGQRDLAQSSLSVPNQLVAEFAARHPARFEWIASIHPYRPDAVDELAWCVAHGARGIKWLPPAMGIDPDSPRCDAFYRALAKAGLALLTHAGDEKAVHGEDWQAFGNPLKLRRALSHGVKVVVAHAATLGSGEDLDIRRPKQKVSHFALFERLMQEAGLDGQLFGEISAVTQRNRVGQGLITLLERQEWHSRLVNGSDYPLPGVMPLVSLTQLQGYGLLQEHESGFLTELRQYNVLLFDLALKRLLRYNGKGFLPVVFESRRVFAGS